MFCIEELIELIIKKISNADMVSVADYGQQYDDHIDEWSNLTILNLTNSFIRAYRDSSKTFDEYNETLEYYRLANNRYKQIKDEAKTMMILKREDKIYMLHKKKEFEKMSIDLDDRDYIIQILEYLYIIAIELTLQRNYINNLKKEEKYILPSKIKIMHIEKKDNRSNMLKRSNNPIMSLEEYANKVMIALKNAEENTLPIKKNMENIDNTENYRDEEQKNLEKQDHDMRGTGNKKGHG